MSTPPLTPHTTLRSLAQARGIAIGTAVNTQALQSDSQYRDILSQQFNTITPENAMKIMAIQPERDLYSFKDGDAVVAFAKENTMQVRGHVLAWGAHSTIPLWLTNGKFSRSTLMAILRDYIHTVVSHYRGQVNTWDVASEALDADNFWMDKIGPDYIDWAFRWAHEADPQARLFYNDYESEELSKKSSDQIYNLVKGLLQRGVPIDGVGLEMHLSLGKQLPMPQEVLTNMKSLADLGLEVQITEMDVQIHGASGTMQEKLAQQASAYRDILGACLSVTKCTAFVMWGFSDRYSWIPSFTGHPDAPLIFDESYHPKPAYCALIAELAPPSDKSVLC
jgi:endo-1,4-beta-xylanase